MGNTQVGRGGIINSEEEIPEIIDVLEPQGYYDDQDSEEEGQEGVESEEGETCDLEEGGEFVEGELEEREQTEGDLVEDDEYYDADASLQNEVCVYYIKNVNNLY